MLKMPPYISEKEVIVHIFRMCLNLQQKSEQRYFFRNVKELSLIVDLFVDLLGLCGMVCTVACDNLIELFITFIVEEFCKMYLGFLIWFPKCL